jgi:hypothetical protein
MRIFTTDDLPTFGDQIHLEDGTVLVVNETTRSERQPDSRKDDLVFPWTPETERHILVFTVRALEPKASGDEVDSWREAKRKKADEGRG